MEQQAIERIKVVKTELEALVVELAPENASEWDGFDHLYAASRDMRRINIDKLGQLPLPETPEKARPPKEQLPLPESAAVQSGEDSLVEKTDPDLIQTADEEWGTIRSAPRGEKLATGIPPRKARKHGNA